MMGFKEMTFSKKLEHIWEYYRIHIIAGACVLAFLISIGSMIIKNINSVTVVDVAFLCSNYDSTLAEVFQSDLEASMYDESIALTQEVSIENIDLNDQTSAEIFIGNTAKFSSKATSDEFDIIVADRENFELLLDSNCLISLKELVESKDVSLDESFYVYAKQGSDQEETIYGISAVVNKMIYDVVWEESDYVICLYNDEVNTENTIKAFNYLLNTE
jgi:hypothetical protein